jgi:cobalt-zinc-cadmium efflux system membrane fusion protein
LRRLSSTTAVPHDGRAPGGGPAFWKSAASPTGTRKLLFAAALLASAAVGSFLPSWTAPLRAWLAARDEAGQAAGAATADGLVKLDAGQIAAARIETIHAEAGSIRREIVAPATIVVDPDRIGRVAAKVAGAVAEMRKKLGDPVEKGEIVAIIDSREVADAKSEFLAAKVGLDLQTALFQREKGLYEKKISAEQVFLRARTAFEEAKLRVELARQKLAALDLSEAEIAALPRQPVEELRHKEIRAPIAGKVIERRANLGQPEAQDGELYVIADLSVVYAEIAVPIADLHDVRENERVRLSHGGEAEGEGRVVFISPMLDHETHSGRAIASFPNADFALRPGTAMTARVSLAERPVRVEVPRAAVTSFDGESVVFVRVEDGFAKRKVETGERDEDGIEILSGLEPGETIAATNVFTLKAELGKARLEGLD